MGRTTQRTGNLLHDKTLWLGLVTPLFVGVLVGCTVESRTVVQSAPQPQRIERVPAHPQAVVPEDPTTRSRPARQPARVTSVRHRPGDDSDAGQRKADPEASRSFMRELDQPAQSMQETNAPPRVAAVGLENTARGEASGMKADAVTRMATLKPGQRSTTKVVIAPGQCVTFVAQGGIGVEEVDLFLTTGVGDAVRVLMEDPTSGPIAVLGGRGGCFGNEGTTAMTVELSVRLRRGEGVVLVRGYSR